MVVWLTGLSGSGKSTMARAIEQELLERGTPVEVLDGDVIRTTFSSGLGFSKEDRDENVRRVGHVAALLARHGVVVVVALISPYRSARHRARQQIEAVGIRFIEVFVNAPPQVCAWRDPKGLYRNNPSYTGLEDPYEPPVSPEVECHTDKESVEISARKVLDAMKSLRNSGEWPDI
jgi:adenylylsulfate kinase